MSPTHQRPRHRPRQFAAAVRGFTLLELMIVLLIIGISAGTVLLASRSTDDSLLYRQAEQLTAAMEIGRAQSRARGLVAELAVDELGFVVKDPHHAIADDKRIPWLDADIQVTGHVPTLLGPEPILPAQALTLHLRGAELTISSRGLEPFAIEGQP